MVVVVVGCTSLVRLHTCVSYFVKMEHEPSVQQWRFKGPDIVEHLPQKNPSDLAGARPSKTGNPEDGPVSNQQKMKSSKDS